MSVLRQFIHFFALILWVAAALAFVAEWSEPGQGMAKVGLAIVVVIVVSGIFSFWQEHRAEQTLAGLRGLLPRRADVLREGKAIELEMRLTLASHADPAGAAGTARPLGVVVALTLPIGVSSSPWRC